MSASTTAPVYARLTFGLNGRLESDADALAAVDFNWRSGQLGGNVRHAVGFPNGAGVQNVSQTFSFLLPLEYSGGSTWLGTFSMLMSAGVQGGGRGSAGARSLFANSAGVTAVQLLDNLQRPITDATYSFNNGLELYSTTVPEPGTWILLGTGLLAVGGVSRRRRCLTS